jgi:hypothetical protein
MNAWHRVTHLAFFADSRFRVKLFLLLARSEASSGVTWVGCDGELEFGVDVGSPDCGRVNRD